MKFIEMTIEEALKLNNGNKNQVVLVAVHNLEDPNEIVHFAKQTKLECENIIKEAKTIAKACDDFMDYMKCFSVKQDIRNIRPIGKMNTILFKLE